MLSSPPHHSDALTLQTHTFHPDMSPKLSHTPHPVINTLTHISKYIHTQIHNQSSYNTPSRYTLLHIPPPKYTCAFTHPPFRYTHIQTHSTQTIPTHCLTPSPHVPLHSVLHTIQIYPHLTHDIQIYPLTSPNPVKSKHLQPSSYTYTFLPPDNIYAVTRPPHSETPALSFIHTHNPDPPLLNTIIQNTHAPHT